MAAETILILGESGRGKTTSLRNLNPKETFIISTTSKPLPWKGWKKSYTKFDTKTNLEGNWAQCSKSTTIISLIKYINAKMPNIKNIVIDDIQYAMAFEFMDRRKEKGYEKFKEQYEKATGSTLGEGSIELWSDALFKHFAVIYGSDEAENFMQQIDSANLSLSEVHEILRKSGFSLNTGFDQIPLSTIYDNFDSWVKSGVSDSDGQSIDTEDDL